MTGPKLKQILFAPKAPKGQRIADFSRFAGLERQEMNSRFLARKMDIEILKKYAAWKGIDEAEFIRYATGPAPDYDQQPAATVAAEKETQYNTNKEVTLNSHTKNESVMPLTVIMKMLENQEHQNESMRILARTAELNAITIARLSGLNVDELGKIAASA